MPRLITQALFAAILLASGIAVGLWLRGADAHAQPAACPYSGGGPPYRFQTWEGDEQRSLILDAQTLAAANDLLPHDPTFALDPLETGPARLPDPDAAIPAPLLHAIGWIESKATQAARSVDYLSSGDTLLSFDCGYGVMQVTSSFYHQGGLPTKYEALVGTHFAYNVAAGAGILAEKWNAADFFPIVGDSDPRYLESWYYALWGYNGWAASNHPLGPSVDPFRDPDYACDDRRNGYPYQELVLGCVINPPSRGAQQLWDSWDVQLPDLDALGRSGGPLDINRFYDGWADIRGLRASAGPPFAGMNFDLPAGARPYTAATSNGTVDAIRQRVLGDPRAAIDQTELDLASGAPATLTIRNDGNGLLAWRIDERPSWLEASADGGVAVGNGGSSGAGRAIPSQLRLTPVGEGVTEGSHYGRIIIAALMSDGTEELHPIPVSLNKVGAAFYAAGTPQS